MSRALEEQAIRVARAHLAPLVRRFAIGVLKSFQKPGQSIASMMRKLCLRSRIVLDYLQLTNNAAPPRQAS